MGLEAPSPAGSAISGYSYAEVTDFLAAAAVERSRLEAELLDAESRIGRARSAIGLHRVMLAMLLDAQRELDEIRREAEGHATRILAGAERDATPVVVPSPAASATIDLTAVTATVAPAHDRAQGAPSDGGSQDDYFTFLRGALSDDAPLGSGAE
jgi:cell division septum initiation protein DivIVA